jgi:hypothetical protein
VILALFVTPVCKAETEAYFNKVANAIYLAEGGSKAKRPYGILTVKCKTESEYRRVCLNTIRNSYKRWNKKGDFIDFLATTYSPTKGVSHSTAKLNKNWPKNVKHFLDKQG